MSAPSFPPVPASSPFAEGTPDDPERVGRWRDGEEDLRDEEDVATLALRLAGPLPVPDEHDDEDFRPWADGPL